MTPPIVLDSSINDGAPVQYNIQTVPIQIFVNEPAECRWSNLDKSYIDMENVMSCATQGFEINAQMSYTCSGILTGIRNNEANDFFFKL